MPEKPVITVYIDFKSPYAYLAKDPARDLERRFDIGLDWLPYILDIPSYLGSAGSTRRVGSLRKTATRTSGGGSDIRTWIADGRRGSGAL